MTDEPTTSAALCEHGYLNSHWTGLPTGNDPDELCPGGSAAGRPDYSPVLTLPLDERLALALVEDCHTELDDADIANVVAAVLPVARRYGARDEVPRNG